MMCVCVFVAVTGADQPNALEIYLPFDVCVCL